MSLSPIVYVDDEKCVNCKQCIAECPVKYCQNGSGDTVQINHETCIGCGSCIQACTHDARKRLDDWESFIRDRRKGKRFVAIVAPSAAASFGPDLLRLNGYLKELGVEAFFDVSFGAELTVQSYLNHIETNDPSLVIAQPCPVVVNYIELYQPELLQYLAPADSPMLHTIKVIREYHSEFSDHEIVVISPCIAKKREFESTGLGEYNVTFASIENYIKESNQRLADFPEIPYDSPLAERAVLFSTPGGLKSTVEREKPELWSKIRKIEGPGNLYSYFLELPEAIEKGAQPFLLDCLNCEKGCNGGTGTLRQESSVDVMEETVSRRALENRARYSNRLNDKTASRKINSVLKNYWKPDLYHRNYKDRSDLVNIRIPGDSDKWRIYNEMLKFSEADLFNCSSCGYDRCEAMATAIHNGLNNPENCHHYKTEWTEKSRSGVASVTTKLHNKIDDANQLMRDVEGIVGQMLGSTAEQGAAIEESTAAVEQLISSIQSMNGLVSHRHNMVRSLQAGSQEGSDALVRTLESVDQVFQNVDKIQKVNKTIDSVASNTNLLAMNAAIEAAHAGDAGRGFAVVADEIRKLAEQTAANAHVIAADLQQIIEHVRSTRDISSETGKSMGAIVDRLDAVSEGFEGLASAMGEMSAGTNQLQQSLGNMLESSKSVEKYGSRVSDIILKVTGFYSELHSISEESKGILNDH